MVNFIKAFRSNETTSISVLQRWITPLHGVSEILKLKEESVRLVELQVTELDYSRGGSSFQFNKN